MRGREVILCGAQSIPATFAAVGIGPAATLAAAGITRCSTTRRGRHLQDHLAVVYSFKSAQPTLNDELHSPPAS
jgi:hypothetical protein